MATIIPRHLLALPILSREIADAAGELATRIELGEFDDLDEPEMAELCELADLMRSWAHLARQMEQRLALVPGAVPATGISPAALAICN